MGKLVEEQSRLLEIRRGEAFAEPAVDVGEQLPRLVVPALGVPEPAQTCGRPQLQRLRLLTPSQLQGMIVGAAQRGRPGLCLRTQNSEGHPRKQGGVIFARAPGIFSVFGRDRLAAQEASGGVRGHSRVGQGRRFGHGIRAPGLSGVGAVAAGAS